MEQLKYTKWNKYHKNKVKVQYYSTTLYLLQRYVTNQFTVVHIKKFIDLNLIWKPQLDLNPQLTVSVMRYIYIK